MEFKKFYTKEEMEELENTEGINKIRAVYIEPQAKTYLPILVKKDSYTFFKEGECILTINYNDLKAGSKMVVRYDTEKQYKVDAIVSKMES